MNITILTAIKTFVAKAVSLIATLIAHTSTYATIVYFFEEPKMPKSLLKKQVK